MAGIPKEHEELYFDKSCRTQKLETVLSLIQATYHAKKYSTEAELKGNIAKRLKSAFDLFRDNPKGQESGSGTYDGEEKQFESQYTIGHELCVWKNSSLDLNPKAIEVAENKITIRQYFDVFFYNYFQPISGKAVHPLYLIIRDMISTGSDCVSKVDIPTILGVRASNENINGLCNMLDGTSYLLYKDNNLKYVGKEPLDLFIKHCNIKYTGVDGLALAKQELDSDEKYADYIMTDISEVPEDKSQKYIKFKKLLSWFVKQLRINNKLIDGEPHSGKGTDNDKIRNFYDEWRNYGNFTLDCTLQSGYQSHNSKVNYIHNGRYNVRPHFRGDDIDYLYLDVYYSNKNILDDINVRFSPNQYAIDSLGLFDELEPNISLKKLYDDYESLMEQYASSDLHESFGGENLVVYGTPGCGKSYYVEHTLLKDFDKKNNVFRTTFYQDYSNTDFIGQILPTIEKDSNGDDKVTYEFVPGPFALALKCALEKPNEKVALVIEELNRGNAPCIFGDIFQLLDRKDGSSEYPIKNINLTKYLNNELGDDLSHQDIVIPSNLFIYATMNTSDQNVFTLDTAFKRRWRFKKLSNTFIGHPYKDLIVPGTDVTWESLVNDINNYILELGSSLNSEDKQVGVYFIDENGLAKDSVEANNPEKTKEFAYKLLEYLWDDVAKFDRKDWFGDVKSLDELIEKYESEGLGVFEDGVISKDERK